MRQLPILALTLAIMAFAAAAPARGDAAPTYPASELFPVEPGRNAERGFAMAVDGDWLAVGAPRDDADGTAKDAGAVYLFHWSGTTWDQEAKLHADTLRPKALLGFALALRPGVLAAGAPGEGAVYVFAQEDGVWVQVKRLAGTLHGAGAFGRSLALDGDRLAVGAVGVSDATGGAVYLYRRDTWALEQMVSPRAAQRGERFASAVSLAGDMLAVGAPGYDVGISSPAADAGAVYVFQRESAVWQETARLLPPALPGQQLGSAVATDGVQIFAGAPTAEPAGATNSGALFWFVQSGGVWERQQLPAADLFSGDQLGASLALSGDLLVAGAPAPPPAPASPPRMGTGRVHAFRRSGASWNEVEVPVPTNAEVRDLAGFAVAVDGERVVVGAVLGDQGDGAAGAAWSFRCPAGQPCAEEAEAVARDPSAGRSEVSVALASDSLAMGALVPGEDSTSSVYLSRRAGSGWRQEVRLTSPFPGDGFGSAVALDGPLLAVGAPQPRLLPVSPPGLFLDGSVDLFVHRGCSWDFEASLAPATFLADLALGKSAVIAGGRFGTAVAIADGFVAVGAPGNGGGPGAVYLFQKGSDSWNQVDVLTAPGAGFGSAVSLHGGVLAIGAPGAADGAGAAYVSIHGPNGWTAPQPLPLDPVAGSAFGSSVAVGDGVIAVGAPGSGTVAVFNWAGGTWQGKQLPGPEDSATPGLGTSLSLLGNRLAVGAPDLHGHPGRAFLFDRESGVWSEEIVPPQPMDEDGFGAAVALSEDFFVVASPGITRDDRVTVFALPHVMEEPP